MSYLAKTELKNYFNASYIEAWEQRTDYDAFFVEKEAMVREIVQGTLGSLYVIEEEFKRTASDRNPIILDLIAKMVVCELAYCFSNITSLEGTTINEIKMQTESMMSKIISANLLLTIDRKDADGDGNYDVNAITPLPSLYGYDLYKVR